MNNNNPHRTLNVGISKEVSTDDSLDVVQMDGVKLKPYKYNGRQLYIRQENKVNPLCISVDWFETTILGNFIDDIDNPKDVISFGDDVYLVRDSKRNGGTRHFKFCYQLYLHGELFGLINTVPRASILDSNLSIIKIENYILYQSAWVIRFEYIIEKLGVSIHNISRLDIAVDGGNFLRDYEMLLSKHYKKVGRATMQTMHKHNGDIEGFYIGSRSSDKLIRGYDKTDKLKSDSKTYISEMWEANGFDLSEGSPNIERLELTMRRDVIKQLVDFDYKMLENSKYLAGIMCTQLKGFYELVVNDGTKNVTRKKKIQVVDWSYFDAMEIEKLPKTNRPNVVWAVKRTVSFIMRESYAGLDELGTNLWDTAYNESYERCKKYGVVSWFESTLPKWKKEKEYHDLMRKKVKEVKHQRFNKRGVVKVQHPN